MIKFKRYPHVADLMSYYANSFQDSLITGILSTGISTESDARALSLFIWKMVRQMRLDSDASVEVMGSTDNSELLADVHYEISSYMEECGFGYVWNKISDEA